jgi:hypothetical protein
MVWLAHAARRKVLIYDVFWLETAPTSRSVGRQRRPSCYLGARIRRRPSAYASGTASCSHQFQYTY